MFWCFRYSHKKLLPFQPLAARIINNSINDCKKSAPSAKRIDWWSLIREAAKYECSVKNIVILQIPSDKLLVHVHSDINIQFYDPKPHNIRFKTTFQPSLSIGDSNIKFCSNQLWRRPRLYSFANLTVIPGRSQVRYRRCCTWERKYGRHVSHYFQFDWPLKLEMGVGTYSTNNLVKWIEDL